jgi:hypothetical protein
MTTGFNNYTCRRLSVFCTFIVNLKDMKLLLFLAALIILGSGCNNSKGDEPNTESDTAVNKAYSWESTLNDSTQQLEMKKVETTGPDSLSAEAVVNFINAANPAIKLQLVKTSHDTLYIKIEDAEHLTQRMGSTGPTMYFAAAVYNLTEIPGIRFVNFDFEEGDHAQPGTYNRDTFKND